MHQIPPAIMANAGLALDKDTIVGLGVILTAVIGLLNLGFSLRNNRRSSYVSAVTVQRLKWIDELRNNLSRFVALIYQCSIAPPNDAVRRQDIFQEVAHLRMLIRLQLAPQAAQLDQDFEEKVETVFREADIVSRPELETRLKELVVAGQDFLWREWRKVKDEVIYGDPYDTWSHRMKLWYERIDSQATEP